MLVLSFPKSNAGFTIATRSQTREALFEGLIKIFSFIGYTPNSIWFDQMSSAVIRIRDEKGELKIPDKVSKFSNHYGFQMKFCNPNSGNEKGNVENKVGTIRRNFFVPEPTIDDLYKFNDELLQRCLIKNQEIHYKIGEPIEKLFEEEKRQMKEFNKIPFDTAKYESRKVNKYGLVEYAACRYSATPRYIGQNVTL